MSITDVIAELRGAERIFAAYEAGPPGVTPQELNQARVLRAESFSTLLDVAEAAAEWEDAERRFLVYPPERQARLAAAFKAVQVALDDLAQVWETPLNREAADEAVERGSQRPAGQVWTSPSSAARSNPPDASACTAAAVPGAALFAEGRDSSGPAAAAVDR